MESTKKTVIINTNDNLEVALNRIDYSRNKLYSLLGYEEESYRLEQAHKIIKEVKEKIKKDI